MERVNCSRRLELDPGQKNGFSSFVFTNCGKRILGGAQKSVFEYDLVSVSPISKTQTTNVTSSINALGFVSDDLNIYYVGDDLGLIFLMDRRCNRPVGLFSGHHEGITHIDSDGNYLISNSMDNSVKLWDLLRSATPTWVEDINKL